MSCMARLCCIIMSYICCICGEDRQRLWEVVSLPKKAGQDKSCNLKHPHPSMESGDPQRQSKGYRRCQATGLWQGRAGGSGAMIPPDLHSRIPCPRFRRELRKERANGDRSTKPSPEHWALPNVGSGELSVRNSSGGTHTTSPSSPSELSAPLVALPPVAPSAASSVHQTAL